VCGTSLPNTASALPSTSGFSQVVYRRSLSNRRKMALELEAEMLNSSNKNTRLHGVAPWLLLGGFLLLLGRIVPTLLN